MSLVIVTLEYGHFGRQAAAAQYSKYTVEATPSTPPKVGGA